MLRLRLAFFFLLLFVLFPSLAFAQEGVAVEPRQEFFRARVLQATDGAGGLSQELLLEILQGADKGRQLTIGYEVPLAGQKRVRLAEGGTVVLQKNLKSDGTVEYAVAERYRLPAVGFLFLFFFVLTIVLCGWQGLRAIVGLSVSVLIIVVFIVPAILRGTNPFLVSIAGSALIACTSLYLAHGFSRRTTVSLLSTVATLALATLLSFLFVRIAQIFGMGTEEAMFLQFGAFQNIDLRGLLLGGIIIGTLGVLDDVTTAQTVAVDEVRRANPSLTPFQLLRSGMNVGREHMVSVINTLALAYVGASFPLLLLFTIDSGIPLWVTLNSEFLVEEIVRTLAGSSALLFAVPISSVFAAYLLPRWVPIMGGGGGGQHHGHRH